MEDLVVKDQTVEELLTEVKLKEIFENSVTLSNILELTSEVITQIAGNDIADKIEDQTLNKSLVLNIIANRIKEKTLQKGA